MWELTGEGNFFQTEDSYSALECSEHPSSTKCCCPLSSQISVLLWHSHTVEGSSPLVRESASVASPVNDTSLAFFLILWESFKGVRWSQDLHSTELLWVGKEVGPLLHENKCCGGALQAGLCLSILLCLFLSPRGQTYAPSGLPLPSFFRILWNNSVYYYVYLKGLLFFFFFPCSLCLVIAFYPILPSTTAELLKDKMSITFRLSLLVWHTAVL